MTVYILAGSAVFFTTAFMGFLVFAYHAGRNNARVGSERQDASDATQSAEAAQRMLEASTNGVRSDDELKDDLEKGRF